MIDDARERIVAAARELFAEHGFDSVSVRDIAARAGVTHGLLRHHFGSKNGVWQAVVDAADRAFGQSLMPLLQRITDGGSDPVDDTKALVTAIVDASSKYPHLVKLLLAEGLSGGPRLDQIVAGLRPLRDANATLLDRLHQQGYLRQFDAGGFLLFLLLAAAGPFALDTLARGLLATTTPLTPDAHTKQVIETLFGPPAQRHDAAPRSNRIQPPDRITPA